jgi:hypothetical protein
VASQTQFDGHVRKTAGTGGAGSEIENAKQLLDGGVITQAEFAAIKANAVGSARGVGRPVAAGRLSRASLARIPGRASPAAVLRHQRSSGAFRTVERHEAKEITKRCRSPLTRVAVAVLSAVALIAAAGCGSSKPAYCSDRTNLENSVKNLPSVVSSSGISGLQTQLTTIKTDATSLVNAAKTDFPTQTSAVKSSVDALQSAVKALPSSPSASQIAAIAADAASVTSSVKSFVDASKSKCS